MAASGSANKIISSRLISAKNHHIHSARHKRISVQGRNFLYSCLKQDGYPHCLLSILQYVFSGAIFTWATENECADRISFYCYCGIPYLTDSRANEKNGSGLIAVFFGQKIFLRSMIDKYLPLPGNKYCRRKN